MKEPDKFLAAISTMLSSWGGDTPPEAIWAFAEFVEWINAEYNLELEAPNELDYGTDAWDEKINKIKEALDATEG